ncbi:hypothetical protein AB0L63_29960 [Nocardia sp. NPDC051990]|uniref:hypothetical protein n=1 Tax=Nocardia sp. NPDC051990 TaxID=3155285 RepID=UPI0034469601
MEIDSSVVLIRSTAAGSNSVWSYRSLPLVTGEQVVELALMADQVCPHFNATHNRTRATEFVERIDAVSGDELAAEPRQH